MSKVHKLIIPLIDDAITLDDISDKAGFVDIYNEDKNYPYLDNNIFLMYVTNIVTKQSIETERKLSSLSTLHHKRHLCINETDYILYCFISNKYINKIILNAPSLSDKQKLHIFKFWNFSDDDINSLMLDYVKILYFQFVNNVVPEQDYVPEYNKKAECS